MMRYSKATLLLRRRFHWLVLLFTVPLVACSSSPLAEGEVGHAQGELAGETAAGVVPAGLPARLAVGLFENGGQSWMTTSGVPWDVRYHYLVKQWVNNWGWSAYDGSFARSHFDESKRQGYVPAVQYYQMNDEPGGGESAFLSKTQNAATMKSYFGDFKILMQRVKDFGSPVLVMLEADGTAFLQQQTGGNPNAYAAVAATGMPELASLPNTVAGWGLAFLQIRKTVGASNAIMGIHVSAWASSKDIAHTQSSIPLSPEVDAVYNFLAPFGLVSNVTGETYDLLVGDPLDRDADFFSLTRGENRWWDPSDTASIDSRSFNRYAEWLRLWNQKAKRRWVLWQVPLGNSNHRNVNNDGSARAGYKDNRPEYFFGVGSDAHRVKFANSGVVALLFGAGANGQSSFQNDVYTDGQPFMKTHVGKFYAAGGLPIYSGTGDPTAPPPTSDPTAPPPTSDPTAPPPTSDPTAPPPPTTSGCETVYEAENLTHETGGSTSTGWNLWANGGMYASHTFSAGSASINVVASGTSAGGVWPHLVVKLDGVKVGEASVSSTSYQNYTFNTTVEVAGSKVLRVEFDNDAVINGEDRNLIVDKVTVAQACDGPVVSGAIVREVWTGISGTSVALIPTASTPSSVGVLTSLEAPSNVADNYGQRLRGVFVAPATGTYTFWIAGDDNVELWLSSDAAAANKRLIAYHNGRTHRRQWGKYATQKSARVSLVAGARYYIEALGKEGGGGDNLAVGWAKPGQAETGPSEVIPGSIFSQP